MAPHAGRPLLFLDVDGPLIPFGGTPGETWAGPGLLDGDDSRPGLARLNPDHGRLLAALRHEVTRRDVIQPQNLRIELDLHGRARGIICAGHRYRHREGRRH